jgi:hypothetical protein
MCNVLLHPVCLVLKGLHLRGRTWQIMEGKGKIFLITVRLKMKPKMKHTVLKCLTCLLMTKLVELIVRETNTYYSTKKTSFIPLRSRKWDWKPVTKDEMYVVLALFMLMQIIQKPKLRSYFSKKLYFGNSNIWFYYFYGSVWNNLQFYAFQQEW